MDLIEKQALKYLKHICEKFPDRESSDDPESGHERVRGWIREELLSAGFQEGQVTEQHYGFMHGSGTNLMVRIPGKDRNRQAVIGAHYDGDGCGDNASGVSLLLALMASFRDDRPPVDIVGAFWDQEEYGCLGSEYYVTRMTVDEVDRTVYYLNMDSLLFGDYCNLYGGYTDPVTGEVKGTGAYDAACRIAERHGINVYGPSELDGFYRANGTGPAIDSNGIYTSPWTKDNPAPVEYDGEYRAYSPTTIPMSDHRPFIDAGIQVLYFEATNWYVRGREPGTEYMGYYETYDEELGNGGMFMNTEFDTLENLMSIFPGRAEEHFNVFGVLLEAFVKELPTE